jgi:hypothetical protein
VDCGRPLEEEIQQVTAQRKAGHILYVMPSSVPSSMKLAGICMYSSVRISSTIPADAKFLLHCNCQVENQDFEMDKYHVRKSEKKSHATVLRIKIKKV